ncbi:MAG: hypothetical protein RLZZ230_328 [Candidatus Parcubacteria bacterium]
MKNLLKLLVMLTVVTLLSGCAISKGVVTESMDNAKYLASSEAERSAYLGQIQEEDQTLSQKRDIEYVLGRPVPFGDGDTRYIKQWDKFSKIVHVYPGHSPGGNGIETQAVISMRTNDKGELLYDQTGRPIIILANVATQEELGRVLIKGGFQIAAGAVNGLGASLVNRLVNSGSCSGGNCGGSSPIINQNVVRSESTAGSLADVGVKIDTAIGGLCGSGACQ